MSILRTAGRSVNRPRRPFGLGLNVATWEDRVFWAAESARLEAEREAREMDRLADEAAALAALERGHCL